MEWLDNWNKAIDHIEAHLEDDIDVEYIARLACCSAFHFQRMFSYITDVSLSEYIRRRRMSIAAVELQRDDVKIIDLALKYGYDSPTAFNRAFQRIHGIAPSKAKAEGIPLKCYPPISFKITIKGEVEMNYRIEKKDAFKIIGIKEHFTGGIDESFAQVPRMWQEANKAGVIPKLCGLMDPKLPGIMGVSSMLDGKAFDYYIAAASTQSAPDDMQEFTVPASTWAIFECVGPMPTAIQALQKRIITEWLPTSGYEYADAPDIELYFEGDQGAADYKCEVWLPVSRK